MQEEELAALSIYFKESNYYSVKIPALIGINKVPVLQAALADCASVQLSNFFVIQNDRNSKLHKCLS